MKWILALWMGFATPVAADMQVIEDFQEPIGWQYVSDRVMGGISDGGAQLLSDGDISYAALRGEVSTANTGGFIQIRRNLSGLDPDVTAIALTVRGNGETYFVHLRPADARRPWDYYQAEFKTSETWQDVILPLDAFRPSRNGRLAPLRPENIRSIGLVAYGADYSARLDVAEIAVQ